MSENGGGLLERLKTEQQKAEAAKSQAPVKIKTQAELLRDTVTARGYKAPTLEDSPPTPVVPKMKFEVNKVHESEARRQAELERTRPKSPGILKNVKYEAEAVLIGEEKKPEEVPPVKVAPRRPPPPPAPLPEHLQPKAEPKKEGKKPAIKEIPPTSIAPYIKARDEKTA